LVSFVIGNIAFGIATDPVPDGDGQIRVENLKLSATELEAVGIDPHQLRNTIRPFDLVDTETRLRWMGCWFYKWKGLSRSEGVVIIEYATIQFDTFGAITPPGDPDREQGA